MKKLLILVLLLATASFAQKRFLVSPYGDAIPIGKNQGAAELLKQSMWKTSSRMVCTDKATFGFTLAQNPTANINHIGYHQDIMAMWYVAPASGTIDTVFWRATDVGSLDSTVTLRLFKSNIYPGSGPGYDGYPDPSQTTCWGYFVSTNDHNGVAAFPEDATDTTWYSTVSGATPSFTPMGDEIWGFGGAPVVEQANAINSYTLGILGEPNVTVGDPFFITIRIYGPHALQEEELRTGFLSAENLAPLTTHNWKFYEHVATIQPGFTCVGWVARAGFNILMWYTMTVTTNVPPTFSDLTSVGNTLSTGPQPVQATILDCNPEDALSAGVESAVVRYELNGVPQPDIPMTFIGTDIWEGEIPGGAVDDALSYKFVAADSNGFADSTAPLSYKIVALATEWYTADTGAACTAQDISASGTVIDTAAFFVPLWAGAGTAPKDDGTAGPFDMGTNFTLFADTFRYAWVGVNGALALGKSPLDTLDVNANGFATTGWDFPFAQKSGRLDTAGAFNMPGMLIAPFWADLIVGDSAAKYGRIQYGNNANPCLYIVQWDSVGAFDNLGSTQDITTFRAVLNRCDGTVEYQYESVGTTGLDSLALVGMQADSNANSGPVPGWIYVNRNMYPYETKPRDNWCIRFYPNISTTVLDGWNIVSVSATPNDANYGKSVLFPNAISPAYEYAAGYISADPLIKGRGYWMKFDDAGAAGASPGTFDTAVTASVLDKWNLIGGPSGYVASGEIVPTGTTIASPFYGYGTAGYYTAPSIQPGHGYWVKVNGAGTLDLSVSSAAAPKEAAEPFDVRSLNRISVKDATGRSQSLYLAERSSIDREPGFFDLPPVPPPGAFDVRFASQRMLETWSDDDGSAAGQYPVSIQGAAYPVTVSWEINAAPAGARRLSLYGGAAGAGRTIEGSGSMAVRDAASASGLALRISGEVLDLPRAFALGRNYPNPFNPVTRMQVDIPVASDVNIAVYDLLGRLVSTLMTGTRAAGSLTLEWDGRDDNGLSVPTGMYIIRMNAGEFTASQKVLLMK